MDNLSPSSACPNLFVLPLVLPLVLSLCGHGGVHSSPRENDTAAVGSFVAEMKAEPSFRDLSKAAFKKRKTDASLVRDDDCDVEGFEKAHSTKHRDVYDTFDTFRLRDGVGFGAARCTDFGARGGGGGKLGRYDGSSDEDDEDDTAAGSTRAKHSEWHFRNPGESYRYESDVGGTLSSGKLLGPDYGAGEFSGSANKRAKRRKDNVQPAAAEYDNYEYADRSRRGC